MDSIATAAIKSGGKRTRELLLQPPDWKFLLSGGKKGDPRRAELMRLRAYNKGTRLLARLVLLMVMPAFIMPFSTPFIGFDTYLLVVAAYALIILAAGAATTALGLFLDAIWAYQHEESTTFAEAVKALLGYSRVNPKEAVLYAGTKFFIDIILVTMVFSLFMPAMFALIDVLLYLIRAIPAGDPGMWTNALLGLLLVARWHWRPYWLTPSCRSPWLPSMATTPRGQ